MNKENALASGIVAEKDRDKMVDTVLHQHASKNSLDKNQLMILDMLANFDWKRPDLHDAGLHPAGLSG